LLLPAFAADGLLRPLLSRISFFRFMRHLPGM
jgi:hypothetical protein